ncbi:MAG: flagellar protein FlgN [Alcaligenaceae bacterium]|jgi:flagellar biosynthesis/type III secretory pathway chaperone|nr:flagellar protein FlgN [Alcaligenaceae bacterium]
MTTLQNVPEALISCINQEIALVAQFIKVLEDEAKILESGQPDELVACTEKKQKSADQLAAAAQKRDQALNDSGYPADTAGLKHAAHDTPDVSLAVDKLFDLAVTARRLNEANGAAISLLLRHNQQLMETIQRLATAGENGGQVYDASGKSKTVSAPASQPRLKPVKAG